MTEKRPTLILKKKVLIAPQKLEPMAKELPQKEIESANKPILKLKKKTVEVISPPLATPIKKKVKESISDKKLAIRFAAEQLRAEQRAKRMAHIELIRPLLAKYLLNNKVLNETVVIDGIECHYPLALETRKMICAALRTMPECPVDCSTSVLVDVVSEVLSIHTAQRTYQNGLIRLVERKTLAGEVKGAVTPKERAKAVLRQSSTLPITASI
jgi:hypothetical protein